MILVDSHVLQTHQGYDPDSRGRGWLSWSYHDISSSIVVVVVVVVVMVMVVVVVVVGRNGNLTST